MQPRFVHLRVHTEFSLIDGLVRIKPLMKSLPGLDMNAVAITDYSNLFAAVKTFHAALGSGVKPIIGSDLPMHYPEKPEFVYSMLLLCQNELGYKNLTRLVSRAYQEGQYHGEPRLDFEWIKDSADGLIALSGGAAGDIGVLLQQNKEDEAIQKARYWADIFKGRFYLEVQRTNRPHDVVYNEKIVKLAEKLNLPLVATNDVRFLKSEDYDAHEARVCIHDGLTLADPRREKKYSNQQYLKSPSEMEELFSDIPQAITNTVEISKRCNLIIELGKNYLPNFPTPNQQSVEDYLSELSMQGLNQRLSKLFENKQDALLKARPDYESRLKVELDVINNMGFPGYFLIVADFIQWAKQNGVPVGPGRGSGAGSLVAYALGITDLDPLAFDLLFERFLNPERVSMPDFDIDFCMEGRDRVIEYVAQKYGRQSVSQIITFGTMAAKAVIRDVGRVLSHPYGFVDKLAKLIPFEIGMTLTKALEQEDELKQRYDNEEEVKELFDLALKLEGVTRNAGKHAGGVVIAPSELTDFTAIYCEEGSSQLVTQFDKDDVEAAGLVKFDFLGLRTLTIIDWALKTINNQLEKDGLALIDINDIPIDDKKTFDLLKACQTTAVFQLESRGMKELINRLQPDCFEEIIALVALFRPGPLQSGMVDDFIDRKHGRAQVEYPHPDLEQVLDTTYGVILYQEQVMQIAQVLANYTLGAADMLRRAMGKKKPEEMAKQRQIFTEGAVARDVEEETATYIFDLMEKFAGYGFNKSHSAAYALVAYQTAWLKAHHPAAFMAAVLSSDMDNTDKVVNFILECKQMNIKVLPPSVNRSCYEFTVENDNTIIYGLGAIKGVGEAVIQSIVDDRNANGPYEGMFSLCKRQDLRKMNRRVLEALTKSGAFDEWSVERGTLMASVDKALQSGAKHHQNMTSGQVDLFTIIDDPTSTEDYVLSKPWSDKVRLNGEKDTLGFYLTGHPAELYLEELSSVVTPIISLNPSMQKKAFVCGLIKGIRKIMTKRGKRLAIISLEDATGGLDVVAFSEIFESKTDCLQTGKILVVNGEISHDDYSGGVRMTANDLYEMHEARSRFAQCLVIEMTPEDEGRLETIQSVLKAHKGDCVVQLKYTNAKATADVNLPPEWRVSPTDDLINILKENTHSKRIVMNYGHIDK